MDRGGRGRFEWIRPSRAAFTSVGARKDRKIVVVEEEAERVFGAWQHNRLMASLS